MPSQRGIRKAYYLRRKNYATFDMAEQACALKNYFAISPLSPMLVVYRDHLGALTAAWRWI
jgi:hypothetical protein